jgi:hypothetical protein
VDGLGAITRADLCKQVVDVALHSRLADDESGGDLGVREPTRDQPEDLRLSRGQLIR